MLPNNLYLGQCIFLLLISWWKSLSCVWLFVTPWTVAHESPLSMGFSRQEYWSGLPCPPPGDLPDPGIEPRSPALQADSLSSELPGKLILGGLDKLSVWRFQESHWHIVNVFHFILSLSLSSSLPSLLMILPWPLPSVVEGATRRMEGLSSKVSIRSMRRIIFRYSLKISKTACDDLCIKPVKLLSKNHRILDSLKEWLPAFSFVVPLCLACG